MLRHAVHTSKVASIGHRDANVVYLPAKGINHVRLVLPDATEKLLRLLVFVSIFVGVPIPPKSLAISSLVNSSSFKTSTLYSPLYAGYPG